MTSPQRPLVAKEYLTELNQAAERLPVDRRHELVADLTAHVDAGIAESDSEADLRNMLDALGPPADIVAASLPESTNRPEAISTGRLAMTFGVLALVFLPLPILGLFSIPFGITGVVLGIRARRRLRLAGLAASPATAGIVTGSLAIAVPLLLVLFAFVGRSDSAPEPPTSSSSSLPVPTTTG